MASAARTSEPFLFDLSGGELCLDLANTLGDRPYSTQERLTTYGDLVSWGYQADLLDEGGARRLTRSAARRKRAAAEVLTGAKELRERLYRIFASLTCEGQPAKTDLEALNRDLAESLHRLRLVRDGGSFAWSWAGSHNDLDRMLWPAVRSAGDLLTSQEAGLVRECSSERCSWLFVDRSRTHRRRWCDMKTCGNRAKAHRHYQRQKRRNESGS